MPLAAPKPTVFPVTVWLNPLVVTRMPEYFSAVVVKMRGAVWKILLLETVVVVVLLWRSIPATDVAAWKKSKMLLLSMRLPVLLFGLADPSDITPLVGRLAPAGPIALFEIVLLLFAPPVEVLIRMLPPAVVVLAVDEPSTVHTCDGVVLRAVDEADRARAGSRRNGGVGNGQRIAARV